MTQPTFRARLLSGELLAGTFMKTPSVDMLELLILSGLDFVCLDAEHAPFDRAAIHACMAVGRAAGFPLLVRVPTGSAEQILMALDAGATGLVVPHVTDAGEAARIARAARFGAGGRGYASSTRWADYGTRTMPELLRRSAEETVVIAQIEDPGAVEAAPDIAATPGIDALFLGPADLSVALGKTSLDSPELAEATRRTGAAAAASGKAYCTFVPNAEAARALRPLGVTAFFIASDHAWMLAGARAAAADLRRPDRA